MSDVASAITEPRRRGFSSRVTMSPEGEPSSAGHEEEMEAVSAPPSIPHQPSEETDPLAALDRVELPTLETERVADIAASPHPDAPSEPNLETMLREKGFVPAEAPVAQALHDQIQREPDSAAMAPESNDLSQSMHFEEGPGQAGFPEHEPSAEGTLGEEHLLAEDDLETFKNLLLSSGLSPEEQQSYMQHYVDHKRGLIGRVNNISKDNADAIQQRNLLLGQIEREAQQNAAAMSGFGGGGMGLGSLAKGLFYPLSREAHQRRALNNINKTIGENESKLADVTRDEMKQRELMQDRIKHFKDAQMLRNVEDISAKYQEVNRLTGDYNSALLSSKFGSAIREAIVKEAEATGRDPAAVEHDVIKGNAPKSVADVIETHATEIASDPDLQDVRKAIAEKSEGLRESIEKATNKLSHDLEHGEDAEKNKEALEELANSVDKMSEGLNEAADEDTKQKSAKEQLKKLAEKIREILSKIMNKIMGMFAR